MRVRFAPSPTGRLHIGTARTAVFNWLLARGSDGAFILRVEDTDPSRSTRQYEQEIVSDLKWLGLDWDEGPDKGGPKGPYRQSEKRERYLGVADDLISKGSAYHCFCTAAELEKEREDARAAKRMPKYSGKCRSLDHAEARRRLAAGEPATVRFKVPRGRSVTFDDLIRGSMSFETEVLGDFVLVRSDGAAGYNFAVVVDDMDMMVTHVMRGDDHLTNTARHILLFEALGAEPPRFAHLSMIVGGDRKKLSKREGAVSVGDYRDAGFLPEALLNYLAGLSWSAPGGEDVIGRDAIVAQFTVDRVSASPAVFDIDKLKWLNTQWLRRLTPMELVGRARAIGVAVPEPQDSGMFIKAVAAAQDSIEVLPELSERVSFFVGEPVLDDVMLAELRAARAATVLTALYEALEGRGELSVDEAKSVTVVAAARMKEAGIKGRAFYHPVRLALTGKESGPEIVLLLSVWGAAQARRRLRHATRAINMEKE